MHSTPESHAARVADLSAQLAKEKRQERRLKVATAAMQIFLMRTVVPFDPHLVASSAFKVADAMLDTFEDFGVDVEGAA